MHTSLDEFPFDGYEPVADSLQGQTLLITGAAGALGSAVAASAATLGADLVLLDKNERGLNHVYDQIFDTTGIEAGLYPLDLAGATVDDYQELSNTISSEFGALHGLIHCAAYLGQLAPFSSTDATQWQKTFATNVSGPVFLTAALLTLMKESAPASIVFTTDNKSKAYWTGYASSKAAVITTMKTLSDELDTERDSTGNLNITCNAVQPARMRSSLRNSAFPGEDPSSVPDAQRNVPAYLFLLSSSARTINGNVVNMQARSD